MHANAGAGPLENGRFELAAKLVVLDDEELDEDIFLGSSLVEFEENERIR